VRGRRGAAARIARRALGRGTSSSFRLLSLARAAATWAVDGTDRERTRGITPRSRGPVASGFVLALSLSLSQSQ